MHTYNYTFQTGLRLRGKYKFHPQAVETVSMTLVDELLRKSEATVILGK